MRTWVGVLLFAVLGCASAQGVLPREVRERILQAVVELRPYDSALERSVGTSGSGTIISPDGYVLTNFHVVGDNATGRAHEWHGVYVTDPRSPDLEPRFSYWARFVAGDAQHDLAIVRIVEDADEMPLPAGFVFPSMPVGDSNSLIPGDPITVVGYPGISGATITFTFGVVSGFLGEDLNVGGKQWIKTDAKLARGNSGGAAFDEFGVLVGIPTLRVQTQDGNYIEQQDYLRPIALAWPLITANVAGVDRVGGVGNQIASLPPAATQPTTPSPAVNPLAPLPPAATSERAALAFAEVGTLEPGDEVLPAGEYADVVQVQAVAGVEVAVTLTSTAFDAYLIVVSPTGDVVVEVDDAPGMGSDAAAVFVPASSGTYNVIVTSYAAGETGPYQLQVTGAAATGTDVGAGPPGAAVGAAPTASDGVLLFERGRLSSGDFTLTAGEYAHVYELDLAAGAPVWFELTSDDFDAYLVVLSPANDVVLEVDDTAGWGLDVAAGLVPPTSGTYLVAVTSAFSAETGAYELWVRAGQPPGNPDAVSGGTPLAVGAGTGLVGALTPGEQVRAQLAGAGEGIAYHTYYVEVPAGAPQLVVEMAADVDLDLFLKYGSEIVSLGDEGDWDYRDIDAAPRATFTVAAPASGRWYVDVVWLGGGDGTARYTLRAR
jgi:S1-C subfamily serine protease